MSKQGNRHIIAGMVGNVLEWFDYSIYGYFAIAISANFFPGHDPIVSLMLSFMVFGLGFVARPIGGFLFGHLGDRLGRKNTLSTTVILMGASTFVMGLLPTYNSIGIVAPFILTAVRLCQGIAAGGEWGSAVSFLGEYAKPTNRAFIVSFSQGGSALGLLLGSLTGLLFTNVMPQEMLIAWGWRVAFLFGVVIAIFGYFMRRGIEETPVFQKTEVVKQPIREVFKSHRRTMITQFFLTWGALVVYWITFSYMPTYINVFLELPIQTGFSLTAVTLVVYILVLPVNGVLADKFGRKPMMLIGGGGITVLGYPLFTILAKATSFGSMALVVCVMAALFAMFNGSLTCLMSELYPAKVRVTGFSIPYQLGSACFAGTAAMFATWLVSVTGNVMAMPIYICFAMGVSVMTTLFFTPETKGVKYDE